MYTRCPLKLPEQSGVCWAGRLVVTIVLRINVMQGKKILIIAPSWIGDLIMAQSLFQHLKQNYPDSSIDVAAPEWNYPLLARIPEVDHAIKLNFNHGEMAILKRFKFAKELSKYNYDIAVILPNSWKSALIPWFAKIPHRIGWRGEFRYGLINDLRIMQNKLNYKMVEHYVALAFAKNHDLPKELLLPKLIVNNQHCHQIKLKFNLTQDKFTLPIVALCVDAAYGDAKCWPIEYFLQLANMIARDNHFHVWILGKHNLELNIELPNIINFCGKTTLLDSVDLLALANIVVCNDSGLMHIAASLSQKIIGIYGATSDKFTPPLTKEYVILNQRLECSPCFARTCPLGHHNCMRTITPEQVLSTIYNMAKTLLGFTF